MDKKKYVQALKIMEDRFPDEYYDSRIKEKLAEIGMTVDDNIEQAILLERQKARKKDKKRNFIQLAFEFLFGWI